MLIPISRVSFLFAILPIFGFCQAPVSGTVSISFCDEGGQDVYLASGAPTTNYGSHPTIGGNTWTCLGPLCLSRGLFYFPVPAGMHIVYAHLYLYADVLWYSSPTMGPGNSGKLYRVTSSWSEYGTYWANQPSTTTLNAASIPASTTSAQDYIVNITDLATDIQNYGNYGLMLKMDDEMNYYKALQFASSDNPDLTKCPKVVFGYSQFPTAMGATETSSSFCVVFPQPFANNLHVRSSALVTQLVITDPFGQIVFKENPKNKNFEVKVEGPPGVYFMTGYGDAQQKLFSKKILKAE